MPHFRFESGNMKKDTHGPTVALSKVVLRIAEARMIGNDTRAPSIFRPSAGVVTSPKSQNYRLRKFLAPQRWRVRGDQTVTGMIRVVNTLKLQKRSHLNLGRHALKFFTKEIGFVSTCGMPTISERSLKSKRDITGDG